MHQASTSETVHVDSSIVQLPEVVETPIDNVVEEVLVPTEGDNVVEEVLQPTDGENVMINEPVKPAEETVMVHDVEPSPVISLVADTMAAKPLRGILKTSNRFSGLKADDDKRPQKSQKGYTGSVSHRTKEPGVDWGHSSSSSKG